VAQIGLKALERGEAVVELEQVDGVEL
jgi:hypothetical protein